MSEKLLKKSRDLASELLPHVRRTLNRSRAVLQVPKKSHDRHKARKENMPAKKPLLFRFSKNDQAFFAKRLGMMLRAGMHIMESLHMLKDQKH